MPSGHLSGAISFTNATSSVQIASLTALGTINEPFSISLWLRPTLLSGTLVYVSRTATGHVWCMSMMGFASNGSIVVQIWTGTIQALFGLRLSTASVWYHIVQTWSSTNGLRIYINNILVVFEASATAYAASSASNFVTLANRPNNSCAWGAIGQPSAFYGDIDDFRIYSRELTADDICALYL